MSEKNYVVKCWGYLRASVEYIFREYNGCVEWTTRRSRALRVTKDEARRLKRLWSPAAQRRLGIGVVRLIKRRVMGYAYP
jgi:hypothetical protein